MGFYLNKLTSITRYSFHKNQYSSHLKKKLCTIISLYNIYTYKTLTKDLFRSEYKMGYLYLVSKKWHIFWRTFYRNKFYKWKWHINIRTNDVFVHVDIILLAIIVENFRKLYSQLWRNTKWEYSYHNSWPQLFFGRLYFIIGLNVLIGLIVNNLMDIKIYTNNYRYMYGFVFP